MNNGPILLSIYLAICTTFILAILGIPLAYWLSGWKSRIKPVLESIISLPLVLPPSVIGFYFLLAFSPNNWLGKTLASYFNIHLIFSFEGLLLASILYSLPFMIHPIQAGFQNLGTNLKDAAYTLGISPWQTFLQIMLPNIRPAIVSGLVLTFAHTMGEFGVVLMIGGNIPGVTRVASIALYDEVESMHYESAHYYALVLIAISMLVLISLYWFNKPANRKFY